MIRVDARRAGAHARTAGKALLSIAILLGLFVIAIGSIVGERRR